MDTTDSVTTATAQSTNETGASQTGNNLAPIGPDEAEADFIARRSMELSAVLKTAGVGVDVLEAQALILISFGRLIVAGGPKDVVFDYCDRVFDAISENVEKAKQAAFLNMPMVSAAVNG